MSNVVLITVDSLRADHLGAYGYDRDTSPTIDEMASDGLSFDAYANSNWTRASFPSILTSTYPLEYGGFEYLSDSRVTIGETMRAAGYRTAAFHSNLWLSRDYNYDRGFDHFYDSKTEPGLLSRFRTNVKLRLNHDSLVYRALQWVYDNTEEKAGLDVGQTYKDAETITNRAIEWLDTLPAQRDVFCWIHYMDVHHPYVPHKRDACDLDLDLSLSEREAIQLRRKMLKQPNELADEEFQTLLDLYDTEIRYTDRHIGRLRDAVATSFGLEDTAFVVTGDHGEEFREHGGFSHNPGLYDEVLHVPFVIEGADRVGTTDSNGAQPELLELLDTAPTICDLGGAGPPENYRGRSAMDAVGTGEDCDLIAEAWRENDAKLCRRYAGWKCIWDRDAEVIELYDLDADPGETTDVSTEHSDVVKKYCSVMRKHLAKVRETNEVLPNVAMDSSTEARLRDLGYLG